MSPAAGKTDARTSVGPSGRGHDDTGGPGTGRHVVPAIVGIVFAINVVPAFAPPTWAVLVLLRLETGVPGWSIVLLGALGAAAGRLTLAVMTRRLRGHLSVERVANLDAGRELLTSGRTRGVALVALFAVSPLPSAQLFEAAGLLDVPLVRFTAAFFAGRIVSYSFYVAIASVATRSFGTLIRDTLFVHSGCWSRSR